MQPSDSPAASARLRSSLGVPYLLGRMLLLCVTATLHRKAGRQVVRSLTGVGGGQRSLRSPQHPEGVQGPPRLPGHPLRPCRSRPPRRSPRGSPCRRKRCCLQGIRTPGHSRESFSRLHSCGPPARLTTHQPPPCGRGCKPGYQPAGYALAGWGLHPLDDSSEFQSTSSTFPLTGSAWSLPDFAATCHLVMLAQVLACSPVRFR